MVDVISIQLEFSHRKMLEILTSEKRCLGEKKTSAFVVCHDFRVKNRHHRRSLRQLPDRHGNNNNRSNSLYRAAGGN